MLGLATWMKTVGPGALGLLLRVHLDLAREAVALAPVAGGAGGDDVLPDRFAAAAAGDHVVDGEPGLLRAAVLAGPGVPREDRPAGDFSAVGLARDPHVADEADHVGPLDRHVLGVKRALLLLEQLGLFLQQQHGGAPQRADVDRLIGRIEDQDPCHGAGDCTGVN